MRTLRSTSLHVTPRGRLSVCVALVLLATIIPLAGADQPATPTPVDDVLYARSFRLDVGIESRWGAERPLVTEGTILVLAVDPELVRPRQVAEPVLYVGDRVAQRIHGGWPSGRMIVLVPGDDRLDDAPVFFGTPELPERVDRSMASAELDAARAAGHLPLSAAAVAAARSEGGATLRAYDHVELDQALTELYERFVAPLSSGGPTGE